MVRLRQGRFAWELYYTRTKAVLPREEVRRRVALIAGHLGYVTGLLEYVMVDMLWLRTFALSGCVLIVGYQVAQPRINMLSAGWNTIFSAVNIYHIFLLVRGLPELSAEEAELLSVHVGHMTPQQYRLVLEAGTWREFAAGDLLCESPEADGDGAVAEVCLVAAGECEVVMDGLIVARIGPGGVAGEVAIAARGMAGDAGAADKGDAVVVATAAMRCLCLPLTKLQQDSELRDALQGVFAVSLAAKVRAANSESRAQEYRAVLEVLGGGEAGPEPAVAAVLEAFRRQHGITDQEHVRVARSMLENPRQECAVHGDAAGDAARQQVAADKQG